MNRFIHLCIRYANYGMVISVLLIVGQPHAAELSHYNAKKIQYASQLQQEGKLGEAIDVLSLLNPNAKYDQAYIARVLGVFYWQNEQAKKAISELDKSVSLASLDKQSQWQTEKMLADIYYSDHQFSKAISHYQHLLVSEYSTSSDKQRTELASNKNEIYLRVANAYYQKQSWKNCLTYIRQFVPNNSNEKIQKYKIQLVSELQLSFWRPAEKTAQRLIELEPNHKMWWQQLIAAQLQQQKTDKALVNYALAKQQGVRFEAQDFRTLSQLYSQNRLPERAAQIMDEMFLQYPKTKTEPELVRQATYWQMAKEWANAEKAWQQAAQKNKKHYWSLAKLQEQQKEYKLALISTEKAKPVTKESEYRLMMVRLYYKLSRYNDALAQAKRLNEAYPSEEVKYWIQYLKHKE
ncbi:tetratricopeptide repeat protein [Aliivibrio finisterrensis]|uniref:Tetratricopeptide repeat protein n=1 Tax=Aliivibrio finisterrensis TaxID=511998 RepID=A0A6N6RYF5_9GAMM|nr:hypothetical protein [Aliivibrio finisterrensis]KAB2826483.1 hypothetical protein F8B77_01100 [Aliivibrio finisterrensis]